MDVKGAVVAAKKWVTDVYQSEGITNVGLEEIVLEPSDGVWQITIGFNRLWNSLRDSMDVLKGESTGKRIYKIVTVKENDGTVVSIKNREVD